MQPLTISSYTLSSALGAGVDHQWASLRDSRSGLNRCTFDRAADMNTFVGEVAGVSQQTVPAHLEQFDCRNNRLAALALDCDGFSESVAAATQRYGSDRIGVFIGTSTSGIHHTELAYRELDLETLKLPHWYDYQGSHNCFSVSDFVRRFLGLSGPASTVSTACSSSAKVFASAHRAISAGICDAAVVGGVDSLCLTTLYGFSALQLVANDLCRPADAQRQGLSIGEAAGFALLERADTSPGMRLLGYGESGDAHHMSAPHPEGLGAILAMGNALKRAGLTPDQIDYINLHGTGTTANDLTESVAVTQLFGKHTPCSSTKGFIGHTLGAAGIAEAIFCLLALEHEFMPQTLNTENIDEKIHCNILLQPARAELEYVLSNSFGFGGSNCSLVLGRTL